MNNRTWEQSGYVTKRGKQGGLRCFNMKKRFVSKMLTRIKKLCNLVFLLWITIFPLAILVQLSVPKNLICARLAASKLL